MLLAWGDGEGIITHLIATVLGGYFFNTFVLMIGVGALAFYSSSGGYPRLRIHGAALWVENRWRRGRILDLHELGALWQVLRGVLDLLDAAEAILARVHRDGRDAGLGDVVIR